MTISNQTLRLQPEDNARLATLCGEYNNHLQQIESHLSVAITARGNIFNIRGKSDDIARTSAILKQLYQQTQHNEMLSDEKVFMAISNHRAGNGSAGQQTATDNINHNKANETSAVKQDKPLQSNGHDLSDLPPPKHQVFNTPKMKISGQNPSQRHYISQMLLHDVSFGIGPAGTGKTYLAVACAVSALTQHEIKRIILVRPAVEAGERLGFLPGDIGQKVDPYLRPLYDAMYDMLGFEKVAKLIEKNIIEIAPLAYMRGRTLNDAAVILDEAQNTTIEQMKMFLTRVGFGSKAMITGDLTQIDLPKNVKSGLRHAAEVLESIDEIGFTYFSPEDVVRHPLVQRIVKAYEAFDKNANTK